jgi:hypothetical protein
MSLTVQTEVGPVVLKELYDGFQKGISGGGPWIREKYLCPDWSLADKVCNAALGLTYGVGGINGTIIRQAPIFHPASTNLFCMDVGPVEGFGSPIVNGGNVRYEQAIIPMSFGVPMFQLGGSLNTIDPYNNLNFTQDIYPFCTQSIDYDSEEYTMEGYWRYASSAPSAVAGKIITGSHTTISLPVAAMTITVHRVPYWPGPLLFTLLKKVNLYQFFGQPTGTVLFDKVRTNRVVNSDGTQTLDVEMVFRWRRVPWYTVPDPSAPDNWITFSSDGSTLATKLAYEPKDLRPLVMGVDLPVNEADIVMW